MEASVSILDQEVDGIGLEDNASSSVAVLSNNPYAINLEFFSGPLDLLLHLVQQQEVTAESVNMKAVCEQYLEVISKAEVLDLNRLTEYLVIAATLVAIKSQALLPEISEVDESEVDQSRDPAFYEELRQRLRQYELTKQRANKLREIRQLGVDSFSRIDKTAIDIDETPELRAHDSNSLPEMFMGLLRRIGNKGRSFCLKLESVSVVHMMMKILDNLQPERSLKSRKSSGSFLKMVYGFSLRSDNNKKSSAESTDVISGDTRSIMVGSFIAILELCRRGVLTVSQKDSSDDITLALRSDKAGQMPASDEVDSNWLENNGKVVRMDDYRSSDQEGVDRLPLAVNDVKR